MGVVFGLADRISVLVYGEIIATDVPERITANAARPGSLSRHGAGMSAMLEVADLHAYYGKSHILQGVTFAVGEGEIVCLLGRNGVGRSTTLKAIMGDVRAARRDRVQEAADRRPASPFEIARLGLGYVPEDRDDLPEPDGAPEPRPRPEGRARRRPLVDAGHVRDLPPPRGARRHAGRRALRRRAADAHHLPHADGRPRADHGRRADRGAGAADGRARRRAPDADRRARRRDPPRRAEAHHRARDLASASTSWATAASSSRARRRTCARTPACARSGWRCRSQPLPKGEVESRASATG